MAMNVWEKTAARLQHYGVSGSMFLWYLWMCGVSKISQQWKEVLNYAISRARYLRSRIVPVNYGPLFTRYGNPKLENQRVTHTFMHGKAAPDARVFDGGALRSGGGHRFGCLYVPQDEMEQFLYELYNLIQDMKAANAVGMTRGMSITEVKDAEGTWRLVMDVDINIHDYDTISLADCITECERMREEMNTWLRGVYDRPIWTHSEWGAWRLKFTYDERLNRQVFVLRGSIHFYTDVVVDAHTSSIIGIILTEKLINMPSVINLDEVSFKPTPMRIPGCSKIMRCPFFPKGNRASVTTPHMCRMCAGHMCVTIAPPYSTPDTFAEWRKRLTMPMVGDTLWPLPLRDTYATLPQKRKAAEILVDTALRRRLEQEAPPSRENNALFARVFHEFPQFGYPVGGVVLRYGKMFFSTTCRSCPFKGGEHGSNSLYYYADPSTRTLSVRCHHKYKMGQTHDCNPAGYPPSSRYLDITAELKVLLFGEPTEADMAIAELDAHVFDILEDGYRVDEEPEL